MGLKPSEQRAALQRLMQIRLPMFACPSRAAPSLGPAHPFLVPYNADWIDEVAKTDYAVSEGDYITDTGPGPRSLAEGDSGKFAWKDTKKATGISFQRSEVAPASVHDGLSQTYLVGEKRVVRDAIDTFDDSGYDQSMYSGVDLDLNRWVLAPPLPDAQGDDSPITSGEAAGAASAVRILASAISCSATVRSAP